MKSAGTYWSAKCANWWAEANLAGRPRRPLAPRELAAAIVQRTLEGGSFLSEALDETLSRSALEPRDRGLVTELAYGVVRMRGVLSRRIDAVARRSSKREPLIESHLLVAAYQLLALDRIPDFAAVNEAVSTLRRLRGPRVAAFGNAILRALSGAERLNPEMAALESLPPWLRTDIERSLGGGEPGRFAAQTLVGGGPGPAHRGLCVRLRRGARKPPAWAVEARRGKLVGEARWLPPRGDLRKLDGYESGAFVVQEEGAQWAGQALGARPGERVLDACAGHGQKASLIAERIGTSGQLIVNDRTASKLEALAREFDRLGLPQPTRHVVDLERGPGDLPTGLDRVLVDAPCSGTGTLRRRPEIALRLRPDDVGRLATQGVAIARAAARCLRPGGRLVYVTCSVLEEECEKVAERLTAADPESPSAPRLEACPFDAPEALRAAGSASRIRLSPLDHGTDGYFVASFEAR